MLSSLANPKTVYSVQGRWGTRLSASMAAGRRGFAILMRFFT
jgi:hypothetical protein